VADVHGLAGLALAAVGDAHQLPAAGIGDRVARAPDPGCDAGVGGIAIELASCPFLISRASSTPNWKLSRRSSMDQLRLFMNSNPSSVSAMMSSRLMPSRGSRLTLVMRMSGSRFQPSARMAPPLARPIRGAVSRLER